MVKMKQQESSDGKIKAFEKNRQTHAGNKTCATQLQNSNQQNDCSPQMNYSTFMIKMKQQESTHGSIKHAN
jgi:hypothetical protein